MSPVPNDHRHPVGITRRELLQVGYSGLLGMGLPSLLAGRARGAPEPAHAPPGGKSVLLIFLTGGPSHVDTFDMKPEAPAEIRGPFRPIDTRVPGVLVCEHLPLLAARADRWAVVRSMTHETPSHEFGTHFVLTGVDKLPPGSSLMASRSDWPCYASGLDYIRPRSDGVPNGVMLPTYLNSPYAYPGQNGGLLGGRYDPWQITQDPNSPRFGVEGLRLPIGLTADHLGQRRVLLEEVDDQHRRLDRLASYRQFDHLQEKAFALLTAGPVKQAFAIEREDPKVRDRYGRHAYGQSLLLARRLIQAGVPIVQANMGAFSWDTHADNCEKLQDRLLPPLDRAVATLLDDLEALGLLDETLVVMVGEFGRTPKLGGDGTGITTATGRDHWPGAFAALFAGAGVQGGRAVGKSDKIGAYPARRGYSPSDLGATVYNTLGIEPSTVVRDQQGRPLSLNRGEVIRPLFRADVS